MIDFLKRLFRRKPKPNLPPCFYGGISQVDRNGKVLKCECLGHPGASTCASCEHFFGYDITGAPYKKTTPDECLALFHTVCRLVEGKKPEAWSEEILTPKKTRSKS